MDPLTITAVVVTSIAILSSIPGIRASFKKSYLKHKEKQKLKQELKAEKKKAAQDKKIKDTKEVNDDADEYADINDVAVITTQAVDEGVSSLGGLKFSESEDAFA